MADPDYIIEVAGVKFKYAKESVARSYVPAAEYGNVWKSQDPLHVIIEGILYLINHIFVFTDKGVDPIVIIRVPFARTQKGDICDELLGGRLEDFAVESAPSSDEAQEMGPLSMGSLVVDSSGQHFEYTPAFLKGPVWRNQDGNPARIIIDDEEYPIPDILVYRGLLSSYTHNIHNDDRFISHKYTLVMKGNTTYDERAENCFSSLFQRGKNYLLELFKGV